MKVLIDHKGLEYFMTTKKLTPRQARWAKFLSEYNFIISYQSGKKNEKVDALTRKLNKRSINKKDKRLEHCIQTLLAPERFKHVVNLEPIKVKSDSLNRDITSFVNPAELHTELHGEDSTLPEEIQSAN